MDKKYRTFDDIILLVNTSAEFEEMIKKLKEKEASAKLEISVQKNQNIDKSSTR